MTKFDKNEENNVKRISTNQILLKLEGGDVKVDLRPIKNILS
jgi:hypothetical protein